MSTLRVSNIEAKADASSPTIDEKIKVTNSQGRVLIQIDGKTSGITTVGINTTGNTFTVDPNGNIQFVGVITAANVNTTGVSTFTSLNVTGVTTSIRLNVGTGGTIITTTAGGLVGIGTTNPTSTLVVESTNGSGRGAELSLVNRGSGTNPGTEVAINFGVDNSSYNSNDGNAQIKARNTGSSDATDLIFSTYNGSTFGERARIDSSGNLQLSTANTSILNSSGRKILNQTGGILQVVQTLKTNSFATTSTSFTDVTGLSVSITPSSTSSKILVMTNVPFARDGTGSDAWVRLVRDSTVIGNGNSGYFGQAAGQYGLDPVTGSRIYLDSPATTSAVTYKIQTATANNTVYIGTRRLDDFILGCDITVMEISG